MWKCPKCRRSFSKINQSHSCTNYPLEKHLKGKERGTALLNELVKLMKKEGIKFNIDSVPCCIHFVNISIFAAAWVLKDKIKIDFRLNRRIKSKIIIKTSKISANRYVYYLEIKEKSEISKEVLKWILESYKLTKL